MFEQLNHKGTIRDGLDITNYPFAPLKDFIGQDLKVDGFFFTEGQYGRQVVVVANDTKINFPSRSVEEFQKIADSVELLDAVLEQHLLITDIKAIKTRNGNTVSYRFADR